VLRLQPAEGRQVSRGVVVGLAISGMLVACAARGPYAMKSQPPRAASTDAGLPTGRGGPEHDEIDTAWAAIESERASGGLTAPFEGYAVTPIADLKVCTHAASDKCTNTCTVSDSICDNAKKICDLAAKVPADAWAAGKCDDGTKSCDQAHDNCCACT
jgi:hypothetical protein